MSAIEKQRRDSPPFNKPLKYSYPPTANDWQRIKPLLTKLYRDDKKTLADITNILQQNHGFRASSRMFKRKFAAWKIERKFKQDEVKYMLVIEQLRRSAGKSTNFCLRGRNVTSEDLRRYLRRKSLNVSDVMDDFSKGKIRCCDDVETSTPRPEPQVLPSPTVYQIAESLCYEWKTLVDSTFDFGLCRSGDSGLVWIYDRGVTDEHPLETFEVFQDFAHYSRAGLGRREMLLLRRGFLLLENMMGCCSFLWWIAVAQIVASLQYSGQIGLAKTFVCHLNELLQLKNVSMLPHYKFLHQLVSAPLEDFVSLTVSLFDILIDAELKIGGNDNQHFTWNSRVDRWRFRRRNGLGNVDTEAFWLLHEGIVNYGSTYPNKMTEALIDDAYWYGVDLKAWYRLECEKFGLPMLQWDQHFNDGLLPETGECIDRTKYMALGCQHFNNGDLEAARWYWTKAVENPTLDDLAMMSTSFHYILEYLDYLSRESKIADGNQRWKNWKADIEHIWQSELDVACDE